MLPALFSIIGALCPAFSRQRSSILVAAVIAALVLGGAHTTLTTVFLQLQMLVAGVLLRYWSLPKLLARRRWTSDDLARLLLRFLLERLPGGMVLADVTHTTTQGRKQQHRHFRPNPKYRKHQQNQSKFLAGNSVLSLAYIASESTISGLLHWVFGLGCLLLRPGRANGSEQATLRRAILSIAPADMLVVDDRGGNDATTINTFVKCGLRFITRLNANAALYCDAAFRQRLDPWVYDKTRMRDKTKIYRREIICYRKRVRVPLKVVIEFFYNRSKRCWRWVYYLSTDTTLSDNEILGCYQQRVRIEHVHYDSKLLCGFNSCRLHSAASIEGYLSLSLLACGVAEYLRYSLRHPSKGTKAPSTLEILKTLGMHW